MTTDDLKATLATFMEQVWNNGDFSQLEALVSPTYEIKDDPGDAWNGQILDHATLQQRVLYSRNAFPDLNFAIQEMLAEGDKVLVRWIMSGTHLGDLAGLPATGKPFAIAGMTIYDFDESGKISGHTQAYDRMGFLEQMGIIRAG